MRLAWLAILAAACGSKQNGDTIDAPVIDGAVGQPDAQVGPDAKPLPDAQVATCTPKSGTKITTQTIAQGLSSPVWITSPPGDARLFVLEQTGRIRIIDGNGLVATPFLDLTSDMGGPVNDTGNEQGLLGLAFHPQYAQNGKFYVQYTRADNAAVLAEYKVTADPNVADKNSARVVLVVPHPSQSNHNSGTIMFGPDHMLWFSTGDGGSGGDPPNNAQQTSHLLGKMLRIDVDTRTGSKEYGIPNDNPFANSADGADDPRPEVWSYGWRNPYRWDFDSNGDQIVADVGQNLYEEVDVIPAGTPGGKNYGWHVVEGTHCYNPSSGCDTSGKELPQIEKNHTPDGWCAIIGGSVYRGSCFPDLVGTYLYTDNCLHQLWTFDPKNPAATDKNAAPAAFPNGPTSIHTDAIGELYVTARDGTVRHIIAGP
ncbi:MAG TPA: PQQ-dependent sugar dehydrogenase [Kofleriaceae bacterium]|nr:PQQ-dependent sugar dehydrogenase [Kofleriaceae bacterium]